MKKIISLMLVLIILALSMPQALAVEYSGGYKEIRVGLFFGNTALSEINLRSEGGFNICFGEDRGYVYHFSMLEKDITIGIAGEQDFRINWDYYSTPGGQMSIRTPNGRFWVNGKEYRGFISLKRQWGSNMTVINVVDIESYLYSVVGKEMSPSWNIEALKAQAVCARTYAINSFGKYASQGFDVCTTQASQVYGGVAAEYPSTIRAVQETAYQVARLNGKPTEVYYFSSSGGITENVEHVWGSVYPQLRSVLDPYENPAESKKSVWTTTLTKDQIKSTLLSKNVNLGDIVDIKITQSVASGRVTELTIYGTADTYVAKRERARTILGLNSQLYTITPLPDGYTYQIDGKGWGHGVGMSQWGAKGMADNGFNYQQILKHYFTGVEVY